VYLWDRRTTSLAKAEALIRLAGEHGLAGYLAVGKVFRGAAGAEQAGGGEIASMRDGVAAWKASGAVLLCPWLLGLLALACKKTDLVEEGLEALTEAFTIIAQAGERFCEAELYRLKGELLLLRDGVSETSRPYACFQRAVEVARKQGAKAWELRATISLARLLANQGHRDEACAKLAEIYNWFTEGFDTVDLKEAKALLDELRT
jgi:predicted ATPase